MHLSPNGSRGREPEDLSWVREEFPDVRAPLIVEGVATARDAARLRHELAEWLAVDGPADLFDGLVLAVYEAIANAAEHAYVGAAENVGAIRLAAHRFAGSVVISVGDEGLWRSPAADGFRGRGLPVMRTLVHDLHIDRRGAGTTVHLRITLPPSDGEA